MLKKFKTKVLIIMFALNSNMSNRDGWFANRIYTVLEFLTFRKNIQKIKFKPANIWLISSST